MRYLGCLARWSRKINLTGAETDEAAFTTLVRPVLGAELWLSGTVIDVGSGNGSPGLILATLRPDLPLVLLEPRAKRWAFLREAAREMGLQNVTVVRERSEGYHGKLANTATMRAVGLAPEALRRILEPGGCVLVFGGPPIEGAEVLRLEGGSGVQRRCFT
ncbi:MAG: RsmG family class I SAM-dependent methyltransferase [Vicinamibacteria bacterium]